MPKYSSADPMMDVMLQQQRSSRRPGGRREDPDAAGPSSAHPGDPAPRPRREPAMQSSSPPPAPSQPRPPSPARRGTPERARTSARTQLSDLCEPLFLYVCRLNRWARLAGSARPPQLAQVRSDLQGLLADIGNAADAQGLGDDYDAVRKPLLFFVDSLVATGPLPFAKDWPRLAHEENEYAGDSDFFRLLDATLAEPDAPAAADRLTVFYTCLALGFEGAYADDRERLHAYLSKLAPRLRERMDTDELIRLCPEAYAHTDRRPLSQPVGDSVMHMAVIAVVLLVVAVALSGTLYFMRTKQLRQDLATFEHTTAAPTTVAPTK